jgi:hypothetical protein
MTEKNEIQKMALMKEIQEFKLVTWFETVLVHAITAKEHASREAIKNPLKDFDQGKLIGLCYGLQSLNIISCEELDALSDAIIRGEF